MADAVPKKQSQSAQVALYLIIGGVLAMIWSGIWYVAMRNGAMPEWARNVYICAGVFLTGLALLVIGVLVGRIGASAKPADTASDRPGAPNPGAGLAAPAAVAAGAMPMAQPGVPVGRHRWSADPGRTSQLCSRPPEGGRSAFRVYRTGMPGPIPRFEDVDPRTLYVPSQRPRTDPIKFTYQLSRFAMSVVSMPAIAVWEDPDGRLLIANGVTRAVRAAKFAPGVLVKVEITQPLKRPLKFRVRVADVLP